MQPTSLTSTPNKEDGTVGKAFVVVDILASADKPQRFIEILEQTPYPKTMTCRLLPTMINQSMLAYDNDSHRYTLGMRLKHLAHKAWQQAALAPIVKEAELRHCPSLV